MLADLVLQARDGSAAPGAGAGFCTTGPAGTGGAGSSLPQAARLAPISAANRMRAAKGVQRGVGGKYCMAVFLENSSGSWPALQARKIILL